MLRAARDAFVGVRNRLRGLQLRQHLTLPLQAMVTSFVATAYALPVLGPVLSAVGAAVLPFLATVAQPVVLVGVGISVVLYIKSLLKEALDLLAEAAREAATKLAEAGRALLAPVVESVQKCVRALMNSDFGQGIQRLVRNLWRGLSAVAAGVLQAVNTLLEWLGQAVTWMAGLLGQGAALCRRLLG